jgi:hypothetical protein
MAGKYSDHYFQRCRTNIMTTILIFFYYPQDKTLERLGEMFEGYSVETCSRKILLVPMGG